MGILRLGASATLATSKHRLIRLWSGVPHSMRSPIHDYLDRPADKGSVPFFILGRMGLWEVQDVRLAILTATRAGSRPALPVVRNMLDRDDGREVHGRVVRTSGRRGICRRDHARRRSPAHFESRDYVLRVALPRALGRRPRSSGQKMDVWSLLHARDQQDGLRRRHLRAAGDRTIKQSPSSSRACRDARSRSSFLQ